MNLKVLLALGTVLLSPMGCEQPAPPPQVTDVPRTSDTVRQGPALDIQENVFNFGLMTVNQKYKHTFQIKNIGTETVTLENWESSSPTTQGRLEKSKLEPGESLQIELGWQVQAKKSMFREWASFKSNDPKYRGFEVAVTGEIVDLIEMHPQDVWILPEVTDNRPVELEGMVFSRVLDQFFIKEIKSTAAELKLSQRRMLTQELQDRGARNGIAVKVRVENLGEKKALKEVVTLVTDIKDLPEVKFEVVVDREKPLKVVGPRWNEQNGGLLSLGMLDHREGASATVSMFVRRGPENMEFELQDADPDFLKIAFKKDEAFKSEAGVQRYFVTITVPPNQPQTTRDGNNLALITVKTNHPERPVIKFYIYFISIRK